MNSMKRQKDRILKEEHPRSVGAQYATGDHELKTYSQRKRKIYLQSGIVTQKEVAIGHSNKSREKCVMS